jgi:DNA-binding NarL/FixJ family response regulator
VYLICKRCLPYLIVKWQEALDALNLIEKHPPSKSFWRAKIPITKEELVRCMRQGMTTRDMARKFGVNEATIVRRKKEFGLPNHKVYCG